MIQHVASGDEDLSIGGRPPNVEVSGPNSDNQLVERERARRSYTGWNAPSDLVRSDVGANRNVGQAKKAWLIHELGPELLRGVPLFGPGDALQRLPGTA
jgi:hypothetical protein